MLKKGDKAVDFKLNNHEGKPISLGDFKGKRIVLYFYPKDSTAGFTTEWQEFRSPDFDRIKSELASPVIFDGRNLYDPDMLHSLGITYYAIGRGQSAESS